MRAGKHDAEQRVAEGRIMNDSPIFHLRNVAPHQTHLYQQSVNTRARQHALTCAARPDKDCRPAHLESRTDGVVLVARGRPRAMHLLSTCKRLTKRITMRVSLSIVAGQGSFPIDSSTFCAIRSSFQEHLGGLRRKPRLRYRAGRRLVTCRGFPGPFDSLRGRRL